MHRLVAILALAAALDGAELRIVSWNVWFDEASGAQRYPRIIAHLRAQDADVICLQECTRGFRERLAASELARDYRISQGDDPAGYCNAILTRAAPLAAGVIALPSRMGRSAPWVDVALGARRLRVVNVHLESLDTDASIARRAQQLALIVAAAPAPCAIVGDVNFGDADARRPELPAGWSDLAQALGRAGTVTYDVERNPFARASAAPGEPGRRLDRMLLSPGLTGRDYAVQAVGLSDHEAILGVVAAAEQPPR